MTLAQRMLQSVPDESVTLFDRGYYSLGLLYQWLQAGTNTHWLLPARKDLQYEVVRNLSDNDAIVTLTTSPQARKKFDNLPEQMTARLTSYQHNGKTYRVLSSLIDTLRFTYDEITELSPRGGKLSLDFGK